MQEKLDVVHDCQCNKMALHPKILSLDNIIISTTETNMFNSKGMLIGQTDTVLIQPNINTIYVTEYKCNDSTKQKHMLQLQRAYDIYKESFPSWDIVPLYVYEEFYTKRVNLNGKL
jgi:hypothetical protein